MGSSNSKTVDYYATFPPQVNGVEYPPPKMIEERKLAMKALIAKSKVPFIRLGVRSTGMGDMAKPTGVIRDNLLFEQVYRKDEPFDVVVVWLQCPHWLDRKNRKHREESQKYWPESMTDPGYHNRIDNHTFYDACVLHEYSPAREQTEHITYRVCETPCRWPQHCQGRHWRGYDNTWTVPAITYAYYYVAYRVQKGAIFIHKLDEDDKVSVRWTGKPRISVRTIDGVYARELAF